MDRLMGVLDLPMDAYWVDGKEGSLVSRKQGNANSRSSHPSYSETHLSGPFLSSFMATSSKKLALLSPYSLDASSQRPPT